MDENIATYKIDLDAGKGMLYALLTIRRDALEEIGWLDAELDKLISNHIFYLSRSKIVFKVKGTLRVKFADGTEKEIGDTLPVQFSHQRQPGISFTHNGEEFMVCVGPDELKSYNPAAAAGPDRDEPETESVQRPVIYDLGPEEGSDMRCPLCEGEVRQTSVITEEGCAVYSTGCSPCGLFGASAQSLEASDDNFRQLRDRLAAWKNGKPRQEQDGQDFDNSELL